MVEEIFSLPGSCTKFDYKNMEQGILLEFAIREDEKALEEVERRGLLNLLPRLER